MGIQDWRPLCVLPLLFVVSYGQLFGQGMFGNPNEIFEQKKVLGPHELFGNPFGDPKDYQSKPIPNDYGTKPITKEENEDGSTSTSFLPPIVEILGFLNPQKEPEKPEVAQKRPDINWGKYKGSWEMVSQNSGVSAMHSILLPKVNKVLMYDATIWRDSKILLPNGQCRILNKKTGEKDCKAHSVLFDVATGQLTPLFLNTDTWCSSGGLTVDGQFVSTGGFQGGANTVRFLSTCATCNWREYPTALSSPRWYATQAQLPDGNFIVVGGRDSFSYEYIPREGVSNKKPFLFPFLKETSDPEENNLYPFVHLSTDGNIFIFANNRSLLLNPRTNRVVREFPVLQGGHRNYPASGMSVLLPIHLFADEQPNRVIPAEVLVCGGSAHIDSYGKADNGVFYTASQDCGRMRITDKNPVWKREMMPTPRIMGEMMILPTGDVLILNGAKRGSSGWGFAREPNMAPVLYTPEAQIGKRMRQLAPTTIPRMYHSSSIVLPDGKVLISGSNTNNGYIYNAMFPTELRVEKFAPPYLNPAVAKSRPVILAQLSDNTIYYKLSFVVKIKVDDQASEKDDIKVNLYAPAFATHGVAMNQRLITLGVKSVTHDGTTHTIKAVAPPSGTVAPPGFYLLSVVRQRVPSVSVWVRLV